VFGVENSDRARFRQIVARSSRYPLLRPVIASSTARGCSSLLTDAVTTLTSGLMSFGRSLGEGATITVDAA
jgi:hypothetical protein